MSITDHKIKAEELRLGNKIYCDELNIDTGEWHQKVIEVSYRDIYNLLNGHDMIKGAYEGIPITEEILLNYGFEKSYRMGFGGNTPLEYNPMVQDTSTEGKIIYNYKTNCYAIASFTLMVRRNSFFVDWIGGASEIKYLHQLQNIYFSLTQEELSAWKN